MNLDPRTKKKPFGCFDIEEAKKFRGKECYFSDDPEDFKNLDDCQKGTMLGVCTESRYVFTGEKNNSFAVFRYCLPVEYTQDTLEPDKTPEEALKELTNFLNRLSAKGKFCGGPMSGEHKQAVLILRSFHEILMAYWDSKNG